MAAISSPPIPPGDVVRLPPVPGGRVLQKYLAGLDDRELLGMVRSLVGGSGSRAGACELLVSRHRNLVYSCVQRYRGGTEPAEDLMQVGYVGLMKAISRFDPAAGSTKSERHPNDLACHVVPPIVWIFLAGPAGWQDVIGTVPVAPDLGHHVQHVAAARGCR